MIFDKCYNSNNKYQFKKMIYHNHRTEPYFTFVKNGQKTIEGRIAKDKYKNIKVDDRFIVHNDDETDSIEVKVIGIRKYPSIKELLEHEDLQKILPNAKNINEGLEIYKKFYTEKQQKEFGVIAIEIKRV